ncbi:MAG TPA: outer membrane beta-barrel protein, partial [Mucilaginibacter sp.]
SSHSLFTNFKDIIGLMQRNTPKVQVDVRNNIEISDNKENDNVNDLSLGGTTYTPNAALTNVTHLKIVDEKPALAFSKGIYKGLDNRFQKSWYFQAFAESQIYLQRNTASQSFQNLERSYYYFIPSASINYYNYQYGDNTQNYSLRYSTSVDYPQIWQLAPLYDDVNSYAIPVGNLALKPSVNENLAFNYQYGDLATKNPFKSSFNLSAGIVKSSFSDSTNYDALGRYTRATINLGDRKYFNLGSSIEKTFKLKDHQFAFSSGPGGSLNRYLVSINGHYYETFQRSFNMSASLIYTYKSIWSAGFGEYFNGNKTDQGTLSRSTYYNWKTNFGLAFAFPKSIFFNTRVDFNNTKSSGQANNVYFTIWNADIGYRFLKGSNAEIKFSALDILHQNRSIYNSVYNNTITTSTANVLQQYFMLTLAYYPRHFGLHKKK